MQVSNNQVVVQLASGSVSAGGAAPVFSVSRTPTGASLDSNVRISAAARALAEVSGMGARPQLNLFVQFVGAFGGSGRSFTPVSPATTAAQVAADAGAAARAAAAEFALAEEAGSAAQNPASTPSPTQVQPAATASAPVVSYQQVAAATAPAPAAPTVNLSA